MDLLVQGRFPTENYWKLLNKYYQYLSDSLVKPDILFKKNKRVQLEGSVKVQFIWY